jgi:U3 small nucleolar RNA-associated protein 5
VYVIDKYNPGFDEPATFTANSTPIHTLIVSRNEKRFLSAAVADRYINVFSLEENKHLGALVAESDVSKVSVFKGPHNELLAAVTTEGIVELFGQPFELPIESADSPIASRQKSLTRKGEAKVRIIRPNGKETVVIADVCVNEEEMFIAWVENGVNVEFERVRWASPEDGGLMLNGVVDITRSKSTGIGANGAVMNGVKEVGKMAVDQAQAVVVGGGDMQDIGMEDAPAIAPSAEEEEEHSSPEDNADTDDSAEGAEEATFADRYQALEISAKSANALIPLPAMRSLAPPTANALTSVLTQALRTNDNTLLESCLHTTDAETILNTVRKLPSPMAVTLLEKLAERLSRKPGRAGSLGDWVRWTLVTHGGYLVTLPNLVRTLSGLYSTLNTRACALPRLLALQGRLDMLHAQVQLRQTMRANSSAGAATDEGVLYVEGQTPEPSSEDEESDEEPEEVGMEGMQIEDASYIKSPAAIGDDEDETGSSAEEILVSEDEDEDYDSDEREADAEAFLDLEASEDEDVDEDDRSVDYDDADEISEDEEEEAKVRK